MYTLGCGKDGQLGHGGKEDKSSPALVLTVQIENNNQLTMLGENASMANSFYTRVQLLWE